MKEKYRKLDRFILSLEQIAALKERAVLYFPKASIWEQIGSNISIPDFLVESDDGTWFAYIRKNDELTFATGNSLEKHCEYRIDRTPDRRIGFIPIYVASWLLEYASEKPEEYKAYLNEILFLYAAINRISLERPEVFSCGEKQVTVSKTIKKDGKYKEVRETRMVRVIRLDEEEFAKRHNNITCPCWGVAGHYRHYKNGKTVFIQAYRKGKKRNDPDEYQPKNYLL